VSAENVEVVRKQIDAYRRGDWDGMAATFDPHAFVRFDRRWPEQFVYGREALIAFYRGNWEAVGPDVHIEEIVDLGDRVLVRVGWSMRGERSGIAGQQPFSQIATVRDDHVIFIEYFLDHEHALAALEMTDK
jgi:ketosteroid isomerase-like protein